MDIGTSASDRTKRQRGCAYCGSAATTRDHVPPRGIFSKPFPLDLVTVPACLKCNAAGSKHEEIFRLNLTMSVGSENPTARNVWRNAVVPSLRRNQKAARKLVASFRDAELVTPAGLFLGMVKVSPWDKDAYQAVICKITRGLYFHEFGERLPKDAIVKTYHPRRVTSELIELIGSLPKRRIGGGQFIYAFGQLPEEPLLSIWFFIFHGHHLASAQTAPAGFDLRKMVMDALTLPRSAPQ